MNVALFTDSYLPTKSGVVTVVVQLRRILEELGHHVVIVTVAEKDPSYVEDDPAVLRVLSIRSPVGDDQYIGLPWRRIVVAFLERHRVQIIHAHTEFTMGVSAVHCGRRLRIPVIATTHTMWEDYYRYYLALGNLIPKRGIRKWVQLAYRRFYAFINVSQKAHDYFVKPFMLPHIPSAIIPNAIDTQKFVGRDATAADKAALRRSLGIGGDDRVLLYVGRVVEEKRVWELLEIIIRVVRARPAAKMLFVGSGAKERALVERVRQEGLEDRILFAGFVDWTRLSLYYAVGHVFVTASLSEMHSMTVLEAMVMGLPVVCRRDTSFTDTVFDGENGYGADSDEAMDALLCALIDDPELGARMGGRGREVSRNFSLRVHGLRTVAFYREVLRHYPGPVRSEELGAAVAAALDERRTPGGGGITGASL